MICLWWYQMSVLHFYIILNYIKLPFVWVEDNQTSTIIGRAATPPGVGRVALWSRCPLGPSGTVSPVIRAVGIPQVGSGRPSVVGEPWLLLACQLEGITPGLISCEDTRDYSWHHGVVPTSAGLWCLMSLPLTVAPVEVDGCWSSMVWICAVSGVS